MTTPNQTVMAPGSQNAGKDGARHGANAIFITYAHAIRNPWDNTIAKPFEFRTVEGSFSTWFEDGEWIAEITVGSLVFADSHVSREEAISLAIFEAEYGLMDESRAPFTSRP